MPGHPLTGEFFKDRRCREHLLNLLFQSQPLDHVFHVALLRGRAQRDRDPGGPRAGAADLLVIKAQPLGGIRRALRIIADAGLPVVVSSALETSRQ